MSDEVLGDSFLKTNNKIQLNLLDHTFNCTVCRLHKNTLGLEFQRLSPKEMKLIMSIFTKNMQPYYDNKKIQNYIIIDKEECIYA